MVVAIDDSRSMSESHCGSAAVESLVTVCRAMSQLEVGQFAVASFGEKGNIKLLHDFDQPFTGEAGIKVSLFVDKQVSYLHLVTKIVTLFGADDLEFVIQAR